MRESLPVLRALLCPGCPLLKTCPRFAEQLYACLDAQETMTAEAEMPTFTEAMQEDEVEELL